MDNLTSLFSQHQKHLITAATILLVVLMAYSAAQTMLVLIDEYSRSDTTTTQSRQVQAPRVALDTSQIRNLFGNFQATEAVVVDQNVPETTLNLELQGVFTAEEPRSSTAIVAQRGQSGQLYRVGERLPGNATLEAVFPNHILIKRGSRTEKLAFDDPSIGQGFARQSSNGGNGASANRTDLANATPNPGRTENIRQRITDRAAQIARERGTTPSRQTPDLRSAITDFQSRLSENPDAVLKELGVSADTSGGYKIGSQVPAAMLQQAGLQEGDVILSVNGQSASSVAGNQSLMNQVMQSDRARVEVQRGQRRFVVTVPIPKDN